MIDVPKGQWAKVSLNTLADVLFKTPDGRYLTVAKGGGAPATGQFAWSGGSFDTHLGRVVMDANGGHGDGADMGMYDFDVDAGLFAMRRAPLPDLIPSTSQPSKAWYVDAEGRPQKAARHNYGGQVYMPSVKRHWQGSGVVWWNGGGAGPQSWETESYGTSVPRDNFGIGSGLTGDNTSPDIQAAWDSNHNRVFYCDHGRLRAYDPARPLGSRVSAIDADGDNMSDGRHRDMSPLYDPKRDRFVMFGSFAEGLTCITWDPVGGKYKRIGRALTPAAYNAQWALGRAPLVAYDPISDRYAIHGGGRSLLIVNPDTWAVTDASPTVGADPGAPHSTGTYNRGGYDPVRDVLVVVHAVNGGAFAYRPNRGTSPPVGAALTERVFHMRPQPPKGFGISGEMKHCSDVYCPPMKRTVIVAGDYDGGSYDQRVWSRDSQTLIDSTDPKAAWRLEMPFCAPAGVTAMPKSPDHVGFTWDSKRQLFWHVPGQYNPPSLPVQCPGITQDGADNGPYKYGHLMQYKALESDVTKRWVDLGFNPGPNYVGTWMSVWDGPRDRLVRFSSGRVAFMNCTTRAWTEAPISVPSAAEIRLTKEYLAHDAAGQLIFGIDGIAGRLYAFDLTKDKMADLGPVPGGPLGSENLTLCVFDTRNRVLLYRQFMGPVFAAYTLATNTWETIPIVSSPVGFGVHPRCVSYDPDANVSIWSGGKQGEGDNTATPPLFVYRHAVGTTPPVDPPPIDPPSVVTPDVTLTLPATTKYKVIGGILVP